jgi:hypothetical protein
MTMGFLAELVIASQGRHDDVYSVAERTPSGDANHGDKISHLADS